MIVAKTALVCRGAVVGALVLGLVAACGSAPAIAPPVTSPKSDGTPETTPPKTDAPPPKPEGSGKTTADFHREFMTGCASKAINSPDYCECAWDEFRKVFSEEEMGGTKDALNPEKLQKMKAQVAGACANKIPESLVKGGYDKGCVADKKEMQAYCDCTWKAFRERFSPAELGDEETVKGDRFAAARGQVVKSCASKLPEPVAKDAFMKGCAKDPKAEKFCGCAWKELRKVASAAELNAGLIDDAKLRSTIDKPCSKLKPK